MRLHDISLNNLRRRKGKAAFLIIGLLIGVTTVVTLITLTRSMEEDMGKKLDVLGANIIIVPKSHELSLNYGGMNVSGVSLSVKPLRTADMERIRQIKNKENLSIIAPKLIASVSLMGGGIFLAGTDFGEELRLKRWWRIMPPPGMTKPGQGEGQMKDHRRPPQGRSALMLRDSLGEKDL